VRLPRLLRAAPAAPPARQRRRARRDGAPRTIVPLPDPPAAPFARDVDAARERLRRAIPPIEDE
jgi:hypothetical protein